MTHMTEEDYLATLHRMNLQDSIDKSELILNHFTTSLLKPFKHIFITGLVAATHLETLLIKRILQDLDAELILHSSSRHLMQAKDPTDPFYLHAKMLKRIGVNQGDNIAVIGHENPQLPVIHITRTEAMFQQTLALQ